LGAQAGYVGDQDISAALVLQGGELASKSFVQLCATPEATRHVLEGLTATGENHVLGAGPDSMEAGSCAPGQLWLSQRLSFLWEIAQAQTAFAGFLFAVDRHAQAEHAHHITGI
jgi:hypothetical protein